MARLSVRHAGGFCVCMHASVHFAQIRLKMQLYPNQNRPKERRIISSRSACARLFQGEGKCNENTYTHCPDSQARSRVKNGTCQEGRRRERSDNERLREEGEGRNDIKIRDTWRKSNRNEGRWEAVMKEEMRPNETGEWEWGETADGVMKSEAGRLRGRNKGMDRLTEGRRDRSKQRAVDICSPTGNTRRWSTSKYERPSVFWDGEVSGYVLVIARGKWQGKGRRQSTLTNTYTSCPLYTDKLTLRQM